jgi:hypothetical protein
VELLRGLLAEPGQLVLARLESTRLLQQPRQQLGLRLDERQEVGAPLEGLQELGPIGHEIRM